MNPKLKSNLDEIQVRFDEILTTEFKYLIEDVERGTIEANLIPRSYQSTAILALIKLLIDLPKDLDPELIDTKHILAAEILIRMQICQELATQVLIIAIENKKTEVQELAVKALGETRQLDVVKGANGMCVQNPKNKEKYRFFPNNGDCSFPEESYDECKKKLGNQSLC